MSARAATLIGKQVAVSRVLVAALGWLVLAMAVSIPAVSLAWRDQFAETTNSLIGLYFVIVWLVESCVVWAVLMYTWDPQGQVESVPAP